MIKLRNNWKVSFDRIKFLEGILLSHPNVLEYNRINDIVFQIKRKKSNDELRVLCTDEYAFGIAAVERALLEFGTLHIISVGGSWNGYTPEAKDFCLSACIGLYNSKEIRGGIWKKEYWAYHQRDEDGNIVYQYKSD